MAHSALLTVRRDAEGRSNAQSVPGAADVSDPFDAILTQAVAPHLGLKTQGARESVAGTVAGGLQRWIEGGFASASGEVTAPRALLRLLPSNPGGAIKRVSDLMYQSGRISKETYALRDVALKRMEDQIDLTSKISKLVGERPDLHPTDRRDVIDALAQGKMPQAAMEQVFGLRALDVEQEVRALRGERTRERDEEQTNGGERTAAATADEHGASFEDAAPDALNPNVVAEDTVYHHYNEGRRGEYTDPDTGEIIDKGVQHVAPEPYKHGGQERPTLSAGRCEGPEQGPYPQRLRCWGWRAAP
ncbi:MAG: hypothetical protein KGN32_03270 [Burkholderiales bacterium]|nr:hypothetical protein [Burkholderiales bacterium]